MRLTFSSCAMLYRLVPEILHHLQRIRILEAAMEADVYDI